MSISDGEATGDAGEYLRYSTVVRKVGIETLTSVVSLHCILPGPRSYISLMRLHALSRSNQLLNPMDSKAPASSLCLFKETRIDVEPTVPNSVIQIKVPSTGAFSIHSRQQRRMLRTLTTYKDADSFSKHGLANSASLYFDRSIQYPRSFLWRVVNDQEILELRAVDLSKSDKETREAKFILQFQFPTPLKHGGVALAGTEDGNALSVFALTKGNELYTFSLLKDFFCYAAASEEDISRWCKVSKLATFSISIPHRLIAGSSLQLVVSLSDGRILQLTRERGTDGSRWHEVTYGDGQWSSSLRGLIRWQGSNTVRYDGTALEQSTPIAMAISPDSNHIFAVCLNHTLRIWNPKKAASVFTKDLLCQNREPHQIPKVMLNPGSPNVLQIFQTNSAIEGDAYYVVTFSPHDVGEFKIWGIRDPDHGDQGVRDLFPEHSFKPPDPDPIPESKAIWKVADFKVKGEQRGEGLEMWILMRSNKCYKLYNTKFDIRDAATLWQDQWSVMASETMHDHPEPQVSNLDPEDVTERWLDYILLPGKYPETVLETALAIYSSERSAGLAKGKFSLKERMYTAIASQVNLSDVGQDFDKHRTRTHQEWIILWQHIHDLDQSRWEVLSLTLDEHTQMPWIAFADGCSAIRSSSKIEQISQNRHEDLAKSMNLLEMPSVETEDGDEPKLPDELAVIIEAASSFRQGFSRRLKQRCKTILAAELWLDPSFSVPLRIQSFYDQCHFADEIGNAPFDDLVIALGPIGGFDNLETGFFSAILDRFAHTMPEASAGLLFTSYGRKLLISGAREMIDLGERILLDLLVLVVFTEMEIDREETPMENFNAARIYIHLLEFLRKYQMMQWLVKSIPAPKDENTKNLIRSQGSGKDKVEQELHSTVLEILYIIDVKPRSHKTQSQSEALTGSIQDLLEWTVAGPMDRVPVYVQCSLLATHDTELASEFVRFLPSTAWAVYVKGRMVLINGNHTEAAIYFKKAAFKLCKLFLAMGSSSADQGS